MKKILVVLGLVGVLAACSTADKEKLGLVKTAPDEFMVVTRAPLTLPPDYDLRPLNENTRSKEDLKDQKFQGLSDSEIALMEKVDAQNTPDDIKSRIDRETSSKNE